MWFTLATGHGEAASVVETSRLARGPAGARRVRTWVRFFFREVVSTFEVAESAGPSKSWKRVTKARFRWFISSSPSSAKAAGEALSWGSGVGPPPLQWGVRVGARWRH